eukprot:GILI01037319.1.p1 GENE.GILI01037319.1~~GILI01037319.1.p1  ORF type:complete len:161 (-),score=7.29 GILI01037319.1:4-486(-)
MNLVVSFIVTRGLHRIFKSDRSIYELSVFFKSLPDSFVSTSFAVDLFQALCPIFSDIISTVKSRTDRHFWKSNQLSHDLEGVFQSVLYHLKVSIDSAFAPLDLHHDHFEKLCEFAVEAEPLFRVVCAMGVARSGHAPLAVRILREVERECIEALGLELWC